MTLNRNMLRLLHVIVLAAVFDCAACASDMYLSSLTSMNSRLSNDHITAICIDRYGFAWIGTASGLNRYDAHNMQTFRADDLGLHTDYVRTIYEDRSGDVWVGTDSGLTMYDRDMDMFVPISCLSDRGYSITKRVVCIGEGDDGEIWMSVGEQGVFCYSKADSTLRQFCYQDRGISSFAFDGNGGILASFYRDNLYYFQVGNFADGSYTDQKPLSKHFSKDYIMSVCHISSGNFAVASLSHGLCLVNVQTGDCRTLISNDDSSFIPNQVISRDGSLFMSTNDGLYVYSLSDGKTSHLRAEPGNAHSLRSNDINCLEYSPVYGLWLGFTGAGVNFSIPDYDKFEKVLSLDRAESLKGVNVTDFSYNRETHSLYVATSYEGVLEYSFQERRLKRLVRFQQPVESICHCGDAILIGSPGGLYEYDLKSRTVVKDRHFSKINVIRLGYMPGTGRLVVGTTLGLFFYDRSKGSLEKVGELHNCSITSFADDGRGSLWVSTMNDGVFRLDIGNGKVLEHLVFDPDDTGTIPNNKCSSVDIDRNGNVWVSTIGSGFCRIAGDTVTRYSMKTERALPSNCFYGIVEDRNGNYWAKTDKGLVKCSFSSGSFRTFDQNNGLSDNNLTGHAQWESISGELFFGSSDGFFYLDPDSFCPEPGSPDEFRRPVFTGLYLAGDRKTMAGEDGSPLKESIDVTGRIELQPWDNSFRITVSAGRLSNMSESGPVEYRLDGYDADARVLAEDGIIQYMNLPHGLYTLRVAGHAPLTVNVKQHWYLTPAAFLSYFVLFLALVALIARYFYVLSARRTRRRQEEKLFDEKLTFFSNVIHEIRTPIMLIKSPLKHLLDSGAVPVKYKEDVDVISQNADYLSGLVGELLDYIRNEKNRYAVSIVPVNVSDLLSRLDVEFTSAAADRNLKIDFVVPEDPVIVMADEPSLVKILNNLLHNAVKYADTRIRVDVAVSSESGEARISVANDGEHIPEDKREEIFKPFVQLSDDRFMTRRGFGIGLAFARSLAAGLGGSLVLDGDAGDDMISFVLTLKLAVGNVETVPGEPEPEDEHGSDETILIVEDNGGLRDYLLKRLSAKYGAVGAEDVEHALEILKRRRISLVISDVSLPGTSGLELCGKLSSSVEFSHIPVILMSSFASDEMKVKAVSSGALLFLEKPFDMDYLAANVDNLLGKSVVTTEGEDKPLSQKLKLVSQADKLFLERMDEFIKENISDSLLDNEALARNMNMSVPTLQRKVKSLTGLTPNRYIRKFRMNVGAQLLATGKCQVSEVSYNVGFNSPSYFSRLFREEYGCLPQDYIRDMSGKVDL